MSPEGATESYEDLMHAEFTESAKAVQETAKAVQSGIEATRFIEACTIGATASQKILKFLSPFQGWIQFILCKPRVARCALTLGY